MIFHDMTKQKRAKDKSKLINKVGMSPNYAH